MRILIVITLLFQFHQSFTQWNSNAGIIPSMVSKSKVVVTSGDNVELITDNNPNTYWESASPLPEKYIQREDLNIFLDKARYDLDGNNNFVGNAFDGITSSKAKIDAGTFKINFKAPESISMLSIKINTIDTVWITITTSIKQYLFTYLTDENYKLNNFNFEANEELASISLVSSNSFEIFEIAGLYQQPKEEVIIDFRKVINVGWIGSRHYNGDGVLSILVFASKNGDDWKEVAKLNPIATELIHSVVSPEVKAQYLKIVFALKSRIYQKAKLHEFEVYDKYGPFGAPPAAEQSTNSYAESIGINAIWGWGYSVSSSQLKSDMGSAMFKNVASLARNYHAISWDIKKPTDKPQYENMSLGKGTAATPWMDWDNEYGLWKSNGFSIDACIMFNNKQFPDNLWGDVSKEAYNYGADFSKHFAKNSLLVSMMEIGNEPWEYSKPVYRKILLGMSKGAHDGSGKLQILPCATQAYVRSSVLDNYISKYITKENSKYISGLNSHIYSYTFDYNGSRIAINPEDPRSEVWSVNNLRAFSKSNLGDIPIYVTEFGYDSNGGGDDCTHSVCVSEFEQAIYGPRMALILYRLGVEQFYWYFYANVNHTSIMHNRSGLTSSYDKGFKKKKSFNAFEILFEQLGDFYFHSIIMENESAYIYAFADKNNKVKRIIAWRPTSNNHDVNEWIEFPCEYVIEGATPISSVGEEIKTPSYVRSINKLKISLSGVPVILKVKSVRL